MPHLTESSRLLDLARRLRTLADCQLGPIDPTGPTALSDYGNVCRRWNVLAAEVRELGDKRLSELCEAVDGRLLADVCCFTGILSRGPASVEPDETACEMLALADRVEAWAIETRE